MEIRKVSDTFYYFFEAYAEEVAALAKRHGVPLDKEGQNGGPRTDKLVKLAADKEIRFSGYMVLPPREDARVTIDAVILSPTMSIYEAERLIREAGAVRGPDERGFDSRGRLVLWWD
ncbi:MAG: hypothetical protein J7K48_08020 [Thermococcus sp.]|nr:hypothetical protein [Thermococcus sp.]